MALVVKDRVRETTTTQGTGTVTLGGAAAADAGLPRGPADGDDLPAVAAAVRPADGGRRHQRI